LEVAAEVRDCQLTVMLWKSANLKAPAYAAYASDLVQSCIHTENSFFNTEVNVTAVESANAKVPKLHLDRRATLFDGNFYANARLFDTNLTTWATDSANWYGDLLVITNGKLLYTVADTEKGLANSAISVHASKVANAYGGKTGSVCLADDLIFELMEGDQGTIAHSKAQLTMEESASVWAQLLVMADGSLINTVWDQDETFESSVVSLRVLKTANVYGGAAGTACLSDYGNLIFEVVDLDSGRTNNSRVDFELYDSANIWTNNLTIRDYADLVATLYDPEPGWENSTFTVHVVKSLNIYAGQAGTVRIDDTDLATEIVDNDRGGLKNSRLELNMRDVGNVLAGRLELDGESAALHEHLRRRQTGRQPHPRRGGAQRQCDCRRGYLLPGARA